jgi:hypothetical protein
MMMIVAVFIASFFAAMSITTRQVVEGRAACSRSPCADLREPMMTKIRVADKVT